MHLCCRQSYTTNYIEQLTSFSTLQLPLLAFVLAVFVAAAHAGSPAPIIGCTIEGAVNYNPLATVDSGDCEFDQAGSGYQRVGADGFFPPTVDDAIECLVTDSSGVNMRFPPTTFGWSWTENRIISGVFWFMGQQRSCQGDLDFPFDNGIRGVFCANSQQQFRTRNIINASLGQVDFLISPSDENIFNPGSTLADDLVVACRVLEGAVGCMSPVAVNYNENATVQRWNGCDLGGNAGADWMPIVAEAPAVNIAEGTEFLYYSNGVWYLTPKRKSAWYWGLYVEDVGVYTHSDGFSISTYHCAGSAETGVAGVGCSEGPGNNEKVIVNTVIDPAVGHVEGCSFPQLFDGLACSSNVRVFQRIFSCPVLFTCGGPPFRCCGETNCCP